MTSKEHSEPKLVVDDDWKSRVEKERSEQAASPQLQDSESDEFPEASFELLVTTFSMQAMSAMGLLRDPQGPPSVNLGMARHLIDMLAVIEQKTRGNLDQDEAEMLQQSLHQLRMLFLAPEVQRPTQQPAAAKSQLELP